MRYSFAKRSLPVGFFERSLVDIHKASYDNFLFSNIDFEPSIKNVLRTQFPVFDSYGYVSIEFVDYRIENSNLSVDECKIKSLTYSCNVFVTFRMTLFSIEENTGVRSVKEIKEQEILLCTIPLMTSSASFIINGIERVVVCQIHRSPGLFFNKKIKDNKSIFYVGTIIPYRGSRLECSIESNNNVFFRIDKKKKLPIIYLLASLNLNFKDIVDIFYEKIELQKFKNDLYSFSFNIDKLVNFSPVFNFRDANGDILISADSVVSKSIARKLQNTSEFYCTSEDLLGSILSNDALGYKVCNKVDLDFFKDFNNSDLTSFSIINKNTRLFNDAIIKAITDNPDISHEAALSYVMKILRPNEPFVYNESKKNFDNIFFNTNYYNLFAVGRYKLNKTLGLNVDLNCLSLVKEDVIETVKKLIFIKQTNATVENIDHLSNRRIRPVGELVENQFSLGVSRLIKYISDKLNSVVLDTAVLSDFISQNLVNKVIREFFMLSELSQFMEQTNLLSELAHSRKVSSLGVGGITRDTASSAVRDIHPSHYGRICPIETPDGQNIGLITSLASYATVNRYGFIETPYRKVIEKTITDQIEYLDASSEESCYIGQVSSDQLDGNKIIADYVPTRHMGEFIMAPASEISYVDVAPRQIISVVASLVPFLECNDTARALMGCNMQRQAVPLLKSEAPFIGTGIESLATKESSTVIVAKRSGIVVMADANVIMIESRDINGLLATDVYHLRKFDRSNQNTLFNQRLIVNIGDHVNQGDIIADGSGTDQGELALGKNVLVAFLPWNGYNYEDSIVVSQRLIVNDEFTSIHIEEFETTIRDTRLGAEEVTRDIGGIPEQDLRYLDESGIVHIGVHVKAGDILVGKVTPKSETPITSEEKLLRAIFGDKISEVRDSSLRMPSGSFGTVVDVKVLTRRGNLKDSRALACEREAISKRTVQKDYEVSILRKGFLLNDITKLLINAKLKIAKNGHNVVTNDLLENINFDDIFNLNIADKDIAKELYNIKLAYDEIYNKIESKYVKDIEKIMDGDDLPNGVLKVIKVYVAMKFRLKPGDKLAGRHGNKGVISIDVSKEDMPFMEDGTPIDIILSPIGVPGRMNIGQVLEVHLGLISHGIGRKLDSMLLQQNAAHNIKEFVKDIFRNDEYSKKIDSLSEDQVISFANHNRKGFKFSTPVFDGAKVEDIERLANRLGIVESGQVMLRDGKTGELLDRPVTVGYMYILKLHHLVDSKMHARSIGMYSLVTQQPLGGKSHFGGQRLGEMECWALQAYGAAYTLQEMLTVKSDDVAGRKKVYESIINGETKLYSGIPESFKVLCKELRSLCFDIDFQ